MSDQDYDGGYQEPMAGEGRPQSNVLGIVGFVLAFCVSPVGLLVSLIALMKPPRGFAIGGVVVGLLGSVVWGVLVAGGMFLAPFMGAAIQGVASYNGIDSAMTAYQQANGSYPTSLDDLTTLTADERLDGWGNAYQLVVAPDGSDWELISAGVDGTFGTADDITLERGMTENEVGNRYGESIQRHFEEKGNK